MNLKDFEGQPWTAWADYMGHTVPPGLKSLIADAATCSADDRTSSGTDGPTPRFMLLNREDIGIYGQYPASEVFELVKCAICKDKFKPAALATHIESRHKGGSHSNRNDIKTALENSKIKANNLKNRDKDKRIGKNAKEKLDKMYNNKEIVNKLNKGKYLEGSPTKSGHVGQQNDGNKMDPGKIKTRRPKETDKCNNKAIKNEKPPVVQANQRLTTKQQKMVENDISMQPVVKLSPLFMKSSYELSNNINTDDKKKLKIEKKAPGGKDRTYNPDRHCGVVGKENTKPCTRSLTCKSHSMSLRRAVGGRSKAFDVLLADHRAEKELEKVKPVKSDDELPTPDPSEPLEDFICDTSYPVSKRVSPVREQGVPKLSLPVSIRNPNPVMDFFEHPFGGPLEEPLENPLEHPLGDPLEDALGGEALDDPLDSDPNGSVKSAQPSIYSFCTDPCGYRRAGGLLYASRIFPKVPDVPPIPDTFEIPINYHSTLEFNPPSDVPITKPPVDSQMSILDSFKSVFHKNPNPGYDGYERGRGSTELRQLKATPTKGGRKKRDMKRGNKNKRMKLKCASLKHGMVEQLNIYDQRRHPNNNRWLRTVMGVIQNPTSSLPQALRVHCATPNGPLPLNNCARTYPYQSLKKMGLITSEYV